MNLAAAKLFESSDDWELQFDVSTKDDQTKNAVLPPHILASRLRPDGVMWSDKLRTVEENMSKWHYSKHEKYSKLAHKLREKGWKAISMRVEVRPRGHINHKWHHFMKAVGFTKADSNSLKARVARLAQRCSYFMYCNRKKWTHPPLIESFKE